MLTWRYFKHLCPLTCMCRRRGRRPRPRRPPSWGSPPPTTATASACRSSFGGHQVDNECPHIVFYSHFHQADCLWSWPMTIIAFPSVANVTTAEVSHIPSCSSFCSYYGRVSPFTEKSQVTHLCFIGFTRLRQISSFMCFQFWEKAQVTHVCVLLQQWVEDGI